LETIFPFQIDKIQKLFYLHLEAPTSDIKVNEVTLQSSTLISKADQHPIINLKDNNKIEKVRKGVSFVCLFTHEIGCFIFLLTCRSSYFLWFIKTRTGVCCLLLLWQKFASLILHIKNCLTLWSILSDLMDFIYQLYIDLNYNLMYSSVIMSVPIGLWIIALWNTDCEANLWHLENREFFMKISIISLILV